MNRKNCEGPEQRRRPGHDVSRAGLVTGMLAGLWRLPKYSYDATKQRRAPARLTAQAALFGERMNRRAMMDDLFDFLFTVLISFFIFFFINGLLDRSIEASHSASRTEIAQFHEQASALTHLAIQAQQRGEQGEIGAGQLNQKLEESGVVGGKIITTCEDYETKVDCENDLLNAGIDGKCKWKKTRCSFQPTAPKLQ